MRSIISDFAVMIAIVSMVLTDFLIGLDTPKLLVPDKVSVSDCVGYEYGIPMIVCKYNRASNIKIFCQKFTLNCKFLTAFKYSGFGRVLLCK